MKKTLLTSAFALVCIYTFGQNYIPVSGNVGFGTGNPQFNLEINSETPFLKIRSSVYTPNPTVLTIKGGIIFNMENADKTAGILEAIPPGEHVPGILFATKTAWNAPGPGSTDWYHRMFIHPNGNVGIGTTDPRGNLDVKGQVVVSGNGAAINFLDREDNSKILQLYNTNGNLNLYTSGYGAPDNKITFTSTGRIGIGTTTPKEELSVNGKIRAKEIRVETANWPDYVFAKNYALPSLKETEKHIHENGHLPGIPSANEVKSNGVDLGEMNAKLLQKVEELTLHLIQLDKKVNAQNKMLSKHQFGIRKNKKHTK